MATNGEKMLEIPYRFRVRMRGRTKLELYPPQLVLETARAPADGYGWTYRPLVFARGLGHAVALHTRAHE